MPTFQKKQYILSSKKLDIPDTIFLQLEHGYLYVHKELNLIQVKDVKCRSYIIIGTAFCADTYPKHIIDDIITFKEDSLIQLTRNWTGRWLLIRENELITDATGLMSAFYWIEDNNWMISSSLSFLSNILNIPITKSVNDFGLDWHLLPNTIMPNVSVLFCTQMIKLDENIKIFSINRYFERNALTSTQKTEEVTKRLIIALKNIEKYSGKNILIALTAGKDSRLVLAAALSSKIKFSTYTMEHPKMLIADKKIPRKIAKKYGFQWTLIKMSNKNQNLANDYLQFNGGNSKGADIIFYSSGQHQSLPTDAIIIRSGIFEAGQQYGRHTMGSTIENLKTGFYKYYKTSLQEESQIHAFEKWIKFAEENPIPSIDLRDRFYIEQRVNGWVSAIEQALTINNFDTLQIANCQEIINILLSATEKERDNNYLALSMIKYLIPELLIYPINKTTIIDKLNLIKRTIIKKLFKC